MDCSAGGPHARKENAQPGARSCRAAGDWHLPPAAAARSCIVVMLQPNLFSKASPPNKQISGRIQHTPKSQHHDQNDGAENYALPCRWAVITPTNILPFPSSTCLCERPQNLSLRKGSPSPISRPAPAESLNAQDCRQLAAPEDIRSLHPAQASQPTSSQQRSELKAPMGT